MLSDREYHGYTGFLLDHRFTPCSGLVDDAIRPVAEAGGHGSFERSQAEEILTLGESLIDAWTGIAVCSTDWWGSIGIRIDTWAMSHVQPMIYRRALGSLATMMWQRHLR